jgi:hypothetical protein
MKQEWDVRSAHDIFVGITEENKPLGRPRSKWG